MKVLDLGCGDGDRVAGNAARADVLGVDIATVVEAESEARPKTTANCRFQEGDASNLGPRRRSFGLVISIFGAISRRDRDVAKWCA
jgi:ubiquinone/menaquinone biosynthesis C-methylase UbiE